MKPILFALSLFFYLPLFSQNVGVGTTSPVFKLDVANGSINSDSGYRIGTYIILANTGIDNLVVGRDAGRINTGANNTFIGPRAGYSNTTGYYNSFLGKDAGFSNTTGYYNSFYGWGAGYDNTGGVNNSFFGLSAGTNNTTASDNSFFGRDAGISTSTGGSNAFFGNRAGYFNTTGTYNTALGHSCRTSTSALTNTTVIGYNAIVDASNKVRIGNTAITSIGGQVGWSTFSDGRFKIKIEENIPGLAFIKRLRTVSYQVDINALNNFYSAPNNNVQPVNRQSGFIAQEVEQAAKECGFLFSGVDNPKNENALYGLRYGDFVVPLVKAVQEQQTIIEQQNIKIEMLIKELTLIKEKLK